MKNLTILTLFLLPLGLLAQQNPNGNWLDGTVWKTYFGTAKQETITELRFTEDYSFQVFNYKKGEKPRPVQEVEYFYSDQDLVVVGLKGNNCAIYFSIYNEQKNLEVYGLGSDTAKSICIDSDACTFKRTK